MPIFEYRCRKCKNVFESLVLPTLPDPECSRCHSKDLEKMISTPVMSSDSTKERARQAGVARNKKIGQEKSRAEHEAFHKEYDH